MGGLRLILNPESSGGDEPLIWNPQPCHWKILEAILRPQPGVIKMIDVCCGIAFGKTTLAIVAASMILENYPGSKVMFLEPNADKLDTVFWAEWKKWIPENLYSTVGGKKDIHWNNGSILLPRHRWTTASVDRSADLFRGQNLHVIFDDEAAVDFRQELYLNGLGRLRNNGPICGMITMTTPKVGPYADLLAMPGHMLFRGRTRDNSMNLRSGFEESMRSQMSEMHARRELDGEMVALEGRVWTVWDDQRNITQDVRDPRKPYILAGDIGVQSSWYCLQRFSGYYAIVSEYHADNGGTRDDMSFIASTWGQPAKIITGMDVRSRSVSTGESALIEIKNVLSRNRMSTSIPVVTPMDVDPIYRDKSIQYTAACDAIEARLVRLSIDCTCRRDWVGVHGNRSRSFLRMIQQDAWPKAGAAGWFIKDKSRGSGIEDARDAFLYVMVVEFPPRIGHREMSTVS
jgi:hypothetical protein